MRYQLPLDGWPGRILLIAMVALAVAAGLCLFDDDEMGTDLCAALAVFSATVILAPLGTVHLLPSSPRCSAYVVALHRPDPPPKSPFLS